MVGLEGAGHVAVMDQQAAIRLRDLGAGQDLQAGQRMVGITVDFP